MNKMHMVALAALAILLLLLPTPTLADGQRYWLYLPFCGGAEPTPAPTPFPRAYSLTVEVGEGYNLRFSGGDEGFTLANAHGEWVIIESQGEGEIALASFCYMITLEPSCFAGWSGIEAYRLILDGVAAGMGAAAW